MGAYSTILLLLVSTATGVRTAKPASEFFQLCHRRDVNISSCIKNTLEDLRPRLLRGIPELGIVPMDPLNIPRLEYREGNQNFKMKQVLSNVTIYGIADGKLLDVRMDFDALTMSIDMVIPLLKMVADYEMEGKILILSMRGKGDCTLKFTDVTVSCHTTFQMVTRNGEQYLRVQDLKWALGAGTSRFQFNNLFGGDKALGDAANRFLNENSREAFKAYKHLPEEAFGILFKDLSNKVYGQFPFEELFPE